jgi:hypothetical protein
MLDAPGNTVYSVPRFPIRLWRTPGARDIGSVCLEIQACSGTEVNREDRYNAEKENRFSTNKRMHPDFHNQSYFLCDAPNMLLLGAGHTLCKSLLEIFGAGGGILTC